MRRGRHRDRAGGSLHAWLLGAARLVVDHPKLVVAAWLVAIVAATPLALRLPDVLTEQGASKVVPGTQSARAEALVDRHFPQRSDRQVVLVVTAPDTRDRRVKELLAGLDTRIAERVRTGAVAQTASPYTVLRDATLGYLGQMQGRPVPGELAPLVRSAELFAQPAATARLAADFALRSDWSDFPIPVPDGALARVLAPDGRAALVSVSFSDRAGADPDVGWLRSIAAREVAERGLTGAVRVHATGELALIADTYAQAEADNRLMETVAYGVIALVLLLFFRAVVPAVVTLASIGLAMNVSQAALYALGQHVTLTQFTVTIMTFVMLGAGVDYSMLLSARYRQERLAGRPVREAVVQATVHAGESVLLAGGAVVLAFGATLLSPVDWIPPLGFGGLVGIPIILLAALTLTPSLLVLLGDRFFAFGRSPLADMERRSALARVLRRGSGVARRQPLAVTLAFAVLTVPFAWLVSTAAPTADPVRLSADTDARRGFAVLARTWGEAEVFPTVVVGSVRPGLVEDGRLTAAGHAQVERLADRLARVEGVARVDAVTRPFGQPWTPQAVAAMPTDLRADYLTPTGAVRLAVTLADEPLSPAAEATVGRVAEAVRGAEAGLGSLTVGGATRVDQEYAAALRQSFWQMVALVSVGVFLVLLLALRSLLVPIRLILTIMMSNVWAIGLTVLVFEVWRGEALINDLPVFLVILMMGLGMDYEIFLVTRVRDLVRRGLDDEEATLRAVVDTGRVITAAGLVMAGSLGTMALSSTLMLQQYGVGLGAAVLLDATLVRLLLVPATLLLFRRYNWWLPSVRLPRPRPREVAPA